MILKLSARLEGSMVIQAVLVGSNPDGLRQVGTLRLRPIEWQLLTAVIGLGADRMDEDVTVLVDAPPDIAASAMD